MKILFGLLFLTVIISCNEAQSPELKKTRPVVVDDSGLVKKEPSNPYVAVDISPMDMSYFPVDYPKQTVHTRPPIARVIYSRPHKQGRKIFGALLKYGEPWRLGANEASEIEFFVDVQILGKTIRKGKYVIYAIPQQHEWTIVLNSNLNSWGLNLDRSKDQDSFIIPALQKQMSIEYFSMVFQESPSGADLVMAWDDTEARLPIQFTNR